jgi:hypothetical protein
MPAPPFHAYDIEMDPTQVLPSIVGAGIGTTIVGSLFGYFFNRQLEHHRAHLSRLSRIHEKQVDTLSKLYGHFTEARSYLQLMQKSAIFGGEKPEEYPKQLVESLNSARDTLTFGRLVVPESICALCDTFFAKAFESQQEFAFATWDQLDPQHRLKLREKATDLSYNVIPELLLQIERAGRGIVHELDPPR